MLDWLLRLWDGWFGAPAAQTGRATREVRLHITRPLYAELRDLVEGRSDRPEPLAFVLVRFASESRSTVVAVGVLPMPDTAYVDGPDGANFDTRAVVTLADRRLESNTGLVLAHSHGGYGYPTFSVVDRHTNRNVMATLAIGIDSVPYGAMVLNLDQVNVVVARAGQLEHAKLVVVPSYESSGIHA